MTNSCRYRPRSRIAQRTNSISFNFTLGDAAAWPVAAAIRHFRDEFEWHINNPELSQKQNYGLANYADAIEKVV
jgi:hypothetical protein